MRRRRSFFCGRAGALVGVVPGDEGIRVCGERGTTPRSPKTHLARGDVVPGDEGIRVCER